MRRAFANPKCGARIAAGTEGTLMKALDRERVLWRFGKDGERQVGHFGPAGKSFISRRRARRHTSPGGGGRSHMAAAVVLLLPACGEKVGMRGVSTSSDSRKSPLTPTLSPQAGRGRRGAHHNDDPAPREGALRQVIAPARRAE